MNRRTLAAAGAGAFWLLVGAQACDGSDSDVVSDGMGGDSGDGESSGTGGGSGGDEPSDTGGSNSTGGGQSGGTGASPGTGGSAQNAPCDEPDAEVRALPYGITEDFYYVNEIPEEEPSPARVVDGATCDIDGAGGAGGGGGAGGAGPGEDSCYEFDYVPEHDDDDETPPFWGGIIVQSNEMPDGDGSTGAGVCIEPGATTIRFEAKADNDITDVKFGSIRPGPGSTEHWVRLSSEWAEYSIPIPPGEAYNGSSDTGGVWNGFSAVLEPNNQAGDPLPAVTRVSIRDVTWE